MDAIYVTPGFGQIKNIQEAINIATPGTRIIVSPGLYSRQIKITKPGLIIEAKEINGEVQLSINAGPLVLIDLKDEETCTLRGFKFIHSGERHDTEDENWVSNVQITQDINCALLVTGGVVTAEDCQVTLGSIKSPMLAFAVQDAQLNLSHCEIKGNEEIGSVGVFCRNSGLNIHSCKVFKHKEGGIIIDNKPSQSTMISESAIVNNTKFGILCKNQDAAAVVQHNKIMQNEGPGILIIDGNISKIKENEIKYNEVGIEVLDSSPHIIKNKVRCNFGNGINAKTTTMISTVKINGNQIYENENGICLKGDNLRAIIEENPFIGNNRKAGIRLEESAEADIISNDIYENICQGILLVTQTSANIEKNKIYGNLRANIALGLGKTRIQENRIYKGRCEGVFLFESVNCQIISNEIYENNDGILAVDGSIEINNNSIHDNKRTGITLAGNGECILRENEVFRNSACGFNIRDSIFATLMGNKGFENPIQICVLSDKEHNIPSLRKDNEWKGEVQLPLPSYCNLL